MQSEDVSVRWAAFYIVKAGLLSEGVPASFMSRIAVRRFHSFLTSKSLMIPMDHHRRKTHWEPYRKICGMALTWGLWITLLFKAALPMFLHRSGL